MRNKNRDNVTSLSRNSNRKQIARILQKSAIVIVTFFYVL